MGNQADKQAKKIKDGRTTETEEMLTIEKHAADLGMEAWIYAGLLAAYGWGSGKEMTRTEFINARDAWLTGPMSKGVR